MTDTQTNKIKNVITVFETGTVKGDYSDITIFNDGKNNTKQITYGKNQTTEQGNLKELLEMYIVNNGTYAISLTTTPSFNT